MVSFNVLRVVALFEAAKGLIVLLAGLGVFLLFQQDAQGQAEEIVSHFHLDPAKRYPRIFLDMAEKATPVRLRLVALGALAYALIRFVEAYGLWRQRLWAAWFALISAVIYVPPEVWGLARKPSRLGLGLLFVNLVIVAYLGWRLRGTQKWIRDLGLTVPPRNPPPG